MKYYAPAWEKLQELFKELHAGLNAWRPHQSRETLIRMMEEQVKDIREETGRCRESIGRARGVTEGVGRMEVGNGEEVKVVDGSDGGRKRKGEEIEMWREREKKVWAVVERQVLGV